MADEIDDLLRRTMKTLDDQVPSGYFEDLPNRTLGRLEVSLMQTGSDQEPASLGSSGTPVPPEEDSGLHDIRSLAQTTKQRISSRKITNTASVDDDVVANSSSGWKAVALPEPAKMIALPDIDDLPVRPRKLAEASAVEIPDVTPIGARVPKRPTAKRRNGTIAMVGIGFAAAAGLVLFVATRNKAQEEPAASPTMESQPATRGMATPPPTAPTVTPLPQEIASDKAGSPAVKKGEAIGATQAGSAKGAETTAMDAGTVETTTTGKEDVVPTTKIAPPPVKSMPVRTKTVPTKKGPSKSIDTGKSIDSGKPMTKTDVKSDDDDSKKTGKKAKAKDAEPDFDDLLKEAGETTKAPVKPKLSKTSLSGDDFKSGMGAINGRATGCYKGTPGTVSVRVAIGPDGHVQKVTVTGAFAGTPSGDCVAAAVKAASFPPWDGPPQSFGYSFLLSE